MNIVAIQSESLAPCIFSINAKQKLFIFQHDQLRPIVKVLVIVLIAMSTTAFSQTVYETARGNLIAYTDGDIKRFYNESGGLVVEENLKTGDIRHRDLIVNNLASLNGTIPRNELEAFNSRAIHPQHIALKARGTHVYAEVAIGGNHLGNFMVDTGASSLVLPEDMMNAIPDHLKSFLYQTFATTAAGKVRTNIYNIKEIKVGDVVLNDIKACSIRSSSKLLGMSILNRLENWQIKDRKLVFSKVNQ